MARARTTGRSVALLVVTLGLVGFGRTPHAQLGDGLYGEIRTNKGLILVRLEPERTPLAVAGFVGLAEGTIDNEAFDPGVPYYDGTVFHRVVDGHVIQAGAPDPQRSEARGPGFQYPNEIHADLSHDHAGAVGVANGGPHTNSSQFYVTLGDRSYLDGTYIVFGEVVEGMDVVHSIIQGDVVESVRIIRRGPEAEAYAIDTQTFSEMVAAAETRVELEERMKRAQEERWILENLGTGGLLGDGWVQVGRRAVGEGAAVEPGDRVRVRYVGTAVIFRGHLRGHTGPEFEEVRFAGATEDGAPQTADLDPPAFEYEVGSMTIHPAFDSAVEVMRRGDETLFVVESERGYGAGGFFGPDLPGQPRFVIPPNTMLIYAIEVLDD